MVKISVIVPVYNVAKYLEECLNSIMNQEFQDYEVICVEGGSTDGSLDILRKFQVKDPRFKILLQEGRGLSDARNEGIAICTGQFICFLDSDDILSNDALIQIYYTMYNGNLDFLCFDTTLIYDRDEVSKEEIIEKETYFKRNREVKSEVLSGKELWLKMVEKGVYQVPIWLMALKRQYVFDNDIKFESGCIAEDNLYTLRCYLFADRAMYIPVTLYRYRLRNDSLKGKKYSCLGLYSFVRLFIGLMYIARENNDPLISEQIYIIAKKMGIEIRKINQKIASEDKWEYDLKHSDAETDALFAALSIGRYGMMDVDIDIHVYGFQNRIYAAKEIILYGCGKIGNLVLSWLKINGLSHKVKCFVVSNKDLDEIDGFRVYAIDEDEFLNKMMTPDSLFILSVNPTLQRELILNCKARGINNVATIDNTILYYIIDSINKSY